MHFICHVQYPTISRKFSQDKTQSKKLKLNRPKRGRAPIKKPTNKKFNTLRKTIQKVKEKKKIKQKNRVRQEERETGSGIQRYLNSIIQVSERVSLETALGMGCTVELNWANLRPEIYLVSTVGLLNLISSECYQSSYQQNNGQVFFLTM